MIVDLFFVLPELGRKRYLTSTNYRNCLWSRRVSIVFCYRALSETSEELEKQTKSECIDQGQIDQLEDSAIPNACDICEKEFASDDELKNHRKIHLDVPIDNSKSYKCQNCSAVFR